MNINPLVSIILPVHENNEYLQAAIESVIEQTYENIELIIIANGCSCDFIDTLMGYQSKYNKIKVVVTKIKYLPFALNLGIHYSSGVYIARMDSDDICHKQRIEKQVEYFKTNQDVNVLGTNVNYIDENDVIFGCSNYRLKDFDIRKKIYFRTQFAHPTIMIRKKDFESIGGYMYGAYSEDYDLWLRFERDKEIIFANLKDNLLNYRIHSGQATSKKNARRIFSYDFSLKLRELMLNFKVVKVAGLLATFLDYVYIMFFRKK